MDATNHPLKMSRPETYPEVRKKTSLSDPSPVDQATGRDFVRSLRRARSVNQANKLAIEFQSRFMPNEAKAVFDAAPVARLPRFVRESLRFLLRSVGWLLRRVDFVPGKNRVEGLVAAYKWLLLFRHQDDLFSPSIGCEFERKFLGENLVLFTSSLNSRELLLAFPPRSRRFGVPMPIFLLMAADAGCDVLLALPRRSEQSPWVAVKGIPGGFTGLVGLIRNLVETHSYSSVHTLGLSFSAPMSLLAGVALGATTINPMGLTRDPAELGEAYADLWRDTLTTIDRSLPGMANRINLVVGERDARDVRAAHLIAEAIPGSSVVVVKGAGHNPAKPFLERGQFTNFLMAVTSNFSAEKIGSSSLEGISVAAASGTGCLNQHESGEL